MTYFTRRKVLYASVAPVPCMAPALSLRSWSCRDFAGPGPSLTRSPAPHRSNLCPDSEISVCSWCWAQEPSELGNGTKRSGKYGNEDSGHLHDSDSTNILWDGEFNRIKTVESRQFQSDNKIRERNLISTHHWRSLVPLCTSSYPLLQWSDIKLNGNKFSNH